MDNLKNVPGSIGMFVKPSSELTALELASLMIAQGLAARGWSFDRKDQYRDVVAIAKAVLEEANK